MTRVFYSIAQQFGRSGPSRPLTRIRDALHHEFPNCHITSGDSFPEFADTQRLGDGLGPCYDDRAAATMRTAPEDESDVFVGGGGASLQQMLLFRKTVTLWFSSHYDWANRVLGEEYRACGIKSEPIHPYLRWRAGQEQAHTSLMIVPSEACKSTYPKEIQDKIRVVNFGVDTQHYQPPKQPRSPGHPLRVLYPATNPPRKGIRQVLTAWSHLPSEQYELTITGGVQDAHFGLPPSAPPIKTPGWVSEERMLQLYQESDILLLPSHEEGQALAALEALACGLPIIVTPHVGVTFPLNEKLTGKLGQDIGWLVARADPAGLLNSLVEAQSDRDELARKSRKARAYAETLSWDNFGKNIVKVVHEAIKS